MWFRRVLPRFVKKRLRLLRSRFTPQPEPSLDRLVFAIEGAVALIGIRRRRKGWEKHRLVVRSRSGRFETQHVFAPPDDSGVAYARISLEELTRRYDVRGDRGDLYVEWIKLPRSDRPDGDSTPAELSRQRVGGYPDTVRPPRAQRAVVDGVEMLLDVTVNGNLSLRFDDDPRTGFGAQLKSLVRVGGRTRLSYELETHNRAITEARLVVLGRRSETRVQVDAQLEELPEQTRADRGLMHYRLVATIDFAEVAAALPEIDDIVDVGAEILVEGREESLFLQSPLPDDVAEHRLRSSSADHGGRAHLFVPYVTVGSNRLAYRIERFDSADYAYLRRVLRLSWIFPLVKPFFQIWLIGEAPYKAQDNGLHFFRHVRTRHPRRRAFYVIEATSPDREKVLPLGNVLDRFSRKHILYSLLASRLVSSHHAEYLMASRDRTVVRRTRGVRVFLQHGVTAVKNVTHIYARQNTYELPAERFLVNSELERRIIVEDYGYRPHQVRITGFARFDALFEPGAVPDRTVLIMPTWRESLRPTTFVDSDYYRNWHGFLADGRLQRLLAENGLQVRMVLHPNMRFFADFFVLPNVHLIRQEDIDVQRLIRSSAILITDFSSVAWDFAFLHKPVLYLQFNQPSLVGNRAPHIDFAESLPGPVSTSPEQLLAALSDVVADNCRMQPMYRERAQVFLDNRDQQNCARIYDVVDGAWRPSTALDRVRNARWVQRRWWRFRRSPRYFVWMRRLFTLGSRLPRTDAIVFECDRGTHFGDAPRYLYERLIRRKGGPRIYWANNTTLRLTDERAHKVARHSPTYYWLLSRARYWVNNQNFPPELAKPTGTRFLQTWHGTPLKKMQHDVAQMASRDPDYEQRAARLTGYWDLLLSGSPYATACFRTAFRYSGQILEVGSPRNDVFSWPDADLRRRRVRERLGMAADQRKMILYAPTFRDDNRSGVHWKHDQRLDIARLCAELSDEYVLVVRYHPLVRQPLRGLNEAEREFVVDGFTYPDIQELLLAADVLITDYSSVIFDYALLQRPMLFFTYDLETYRDVLRGFYLDFESVAPGPLCFDSESLVAELRELDSVRRRYADAVRRFAASYAPRDDGGASDRVLDAFFGSAVSVVPDLIGPIEPISRRSPSTEPSADHPTQGRPVATQVEAES